NDIHIASGQEHHLPHEAWHVVQQMQGRVQPTLQHAGVAVNDDPALEAEADMMGKQAATISGIEGRRAANEQAPSSATPTADDTQSQPGVSQGKLLPAAFGSTPSSFPPPSRKHRRAVRYNDTSMST